ncbi:MAG: thioredoxin [Polyangiaceae bacterium]
MTTTNSADDNSFETTVLDAEDYVLVDFWAPWCGPCRMQSPVLEKFASANAEVSVVKVNVDESPQTATRYGIRSIPTLVVFKDGKPVIGTMGLQNKGNLERLMREAKKRSAA